MTAAGPLTVRDKVCAARLYAVRSRPFMATALYAMQIVETPRVPTMAVDRHWRCYVAPGFVAAESVDALAAVLVHEVSHLLRDHHARTIRHARANPDTGHGEQLRMNIAADLEINDDAYGAGLPVPEGTPLPRHLGLSTGQVMEEYLRQFRLGWLTDGWSWLDCGSGAHGVERDWELGSCEGTSDDGGLSSQQREAVRFAVARDITSRRGDVPAGWRRWAHEAIHPTQPWRVLLGTAIRAAVAGSGPGDDYTYGRPSRRSTAMPGVILPSLRRTPPRVGIIIDTSGSVSDADLGSALLEVAAIGRAVSGRRDLVSVVSCDAAANVAQPICAAEHIELIGGGGTDLRAGFAIALRTRPDVVVALTDGFTPWPDRKPSCRTVVGLFGRRGTFDGEDPRWATPPAWAHVVQIGAS
ncbi:VWA-like domain-containing protein [Gordonia sp. NPDC003585]|uniref:vWA domain-containing protein n=1 Tax=unclassified Gordonia (in: high G+C Gram-positive bacteria) TaxID=2657482 RepID=UPI0033B7C4EC